MYDRFYTQYATSGSNKNAILTVDFMEKEVNESVFLMKKAPYPNGFSAVSCQHFWDVIKDDLILMAMFTDFRNGQLPISQLNSFVLTLLLKSEDAIQIIQQYIHICVLNVGSKTITN